MVGFRAFASRVAGREQLRGWVRNRSDGAVECLVEGPPGAVDRFLDAVRRGPAAARVDRVEVEVEEAAVGMPLAPFEARG